MCGIAGIVKRDGAVEREILAKMACAIKHRGPDNEGIFIPDEQTGLVHRRLSIIDLSSDANQPLLSSDKRYSIIFNGEIYNYLELRKELEKLGFAFKTNSDTEVLLTSYSHWGISCLHKLNGMFAFAIYDSNEKSLFLARDRMGIKPLLYYLDDSEFIFASEIRAILEAKPKDLTIDLKGFSKYLTLNYIPAPYTIYKRIRKIPHGCYAIFKDFKLTLQKYYCHEDQIKPGFQYSEDEASFYLERTLEDSVKLQMRSDVPYGTFLSGGVDSSIISGLMSKISPRPVKTFSIGFEDNPIFDESPFAKLVASFQGTEHHQIMLREEDAKNLVPAVLNMFDEPFADSSAVPTFLISQKTKEYVTVALSGDGADELFGGYRKYQGEKLSSHYQNLPIFIREKLIERFVEFLPDSRDSSLLDKLRMIKKFVKASNNNQKLRLKGWMTIISDNLKSELLKGINESLDSVLDDIDELMGNYPVDPLNEVFFVDSNYCLVYDMLRKVDAMSMQNALEVRVPFLDHRVVELAYNMPSRLKIKGLKRKYILLKTFGYLLPSKILTRKKSGFEIPIGYWLKNDLNYLLHEHLSKEYLTKQDIFRPETVRKLILALIHSKSDTSWILWNLLVFQVWYKNYLDK